MKASRTTGEPHSGPRSTLSPVVPHTRGRPSSRALPRNARRAESTDGGDLGTRALPGVGRPRPVRSPTDAGVAPRRARGIVARGRGNRRLHRHLRLHRDVGAPLEPRSSGSGGGHRGDERHVRGAPRRRLRAGWRPAQVRRRRVAAALRRRGSRTPGRSRGIRDAQHASGDRPAANVGRSDSAEDARGAPQRPLPVLPRRRVASRAPDQPALRRPERWRWRPPRRRARSS